MKGAWVTLATNDSYSLGALVLAHSLKQVGTTQELAILVTPGVTDSMRTRLSEVFNLVKEVNVLDSRDQSNLRLLQRPELGITFTKLHCWQLTQYEKCVFLDADTLVLQNCDELFDREEFSAAPDVGWPDCFNSGVFVYRPSAETYDKLIQFALEKGSFDGGDQGLLNLYFSDWAHKDISKHLPFIYNVCSTAFYSYLPAFKQFGKDVKILHFIGNAKPWLQYFDTETRRVRPSGDLGHLSHVLQKWWDIFCHMVHPNLTPDMSGLAGAFAKLILGQQRTPEQEALESNLRRQNWEQGNIDYLGRDSFDNIWSKICETLSKGPQKEKKAEEPQEVSPVGTGVSKAGTEQQVGKETQPSQGVVTAAETPTEEHQAGGTKETCVAVSPSEEINTSPLKEAVCTPPISDKDSGVPLEVTNVVSSELPSKTPAESPAEIVTAPVILTTLGVTPKLSASAELGDVQLLKEKEPTKSASMQTVSAATEPTPTPTAVLQENISQQSHLPEKTNETLPMIPQAPTRLEEATQVISVAAKPTEPLESAFVPSQEESSATNPVSSVPSVVTAQTPIAAKEPTSAQARSVEKLSSPVAEDSCPITALTSPKTDSSQVQIPTPDIPTPISQTAPISPIPSHDQSSQHSDISPRKDIIPLEGISPPKDISLPTQIPPESHISSPKQISPQTQIPFPVETSPQSQSTAEVPSTTVPPFCTDKSVTAEAPQVVSPVKTSASSTKPTDSSVQLESTSVKETSVTAEAPQVASPEKTSAASVKPTDSSVQLESISVKETSVAAEAPQVASPVKTPVSSVKPTDSSVQLESTSVKETSVTAGAPHVASAVKTPVSSVKPTDSSVQLESTSVKETSVAAEAPQVASPVKTPASLVKPTDSATKESQTPKLHDAAVSSNVPTETKQPAPAPSATVEACPIAPPPRKSGGTKKQGKSKK